MNKQILPHNIEAEEAIISSLLLDSSEYNNISLQPNDFYHDTTRYCFMACKSLSERGVSINQITLGEELKEHGNLEKVGGVSWLSHLLSLGILPMDCAYYGDIVKRCSLYRQMIDVASKISDIGYGENANISNSFAEAEELLLNLRKKGVSSPIITPKERVDLAYTRYEILHKAENGVAIATGLTDLDEQIGGGLYAGEMAILGARPGMGKTTMLMTIANNIAINDKVLFCSGEMNEASLTDRDIAGLVGVPTNVIRKGGYNQDLFDNLNTNIIPSLLNRNVYIYHDPPLTTSKIMQASIAVQIRYGLSLVVIDYLGLLDDEYGNNQYERVGYVSRKLKQMAMQLDVPILVAHQLSRALETRDDKRPQLSDLRDSGRIEEDADLVLFLYRDTYYKIANTDIAELLVAKQRQGDSHQQIKVSFDRKHQYYKDYDGQQ